MVFAPRIAAMQPSVSVTLAALGRLDTLAACTKYCVQQVPELKAMELPIVPDSWAFDDTAAPVFSAAGASLAVASVPYTTRSLESLLRAGLPVLAFAPHTLADIYAETRTLAALVDAGEAAEQMIAKFQQLLAGVYEAAASRPLQTIYCEEWGKPLIHSQPWVYELAEAAGGRALGTPGSQTLASGIAFADPDVIALAWCGAGDRIRIPRVIEQRGWQDLRAVREGRIHVIHDEWLNTPALPSLTLGLQRLAKILSTNR